MYFFKKTEKNWSQRKDTLHEERKVLADKLKDGMMSTSQMKKGTDGIMSHTEQVVKYDKWKDINKQDIEKWHGINREFKKQGDEGRIHTLDDLRENKMKFD